MSGPSMNYGHFDPFVSHTRPRQNGNFNNLAFIVKCVVHSATLNVPAICTGCLKEQLCSWQDPSNLLLFCAQFLVVRLNQKQEFGPLKRVAWLETKGAKDIPLRRLKRSIFLGARASARATRRGAKAMCKGQKKWCKGLSMFQNFKRQKMRPLHQISILV